MNFHKGSGAISRKLSGKLGITALLFLTTACQTSVLHFVPPEARGAPLANREPAKSEAYISLGLGIYEFSQSPENPCPDSLETIVIRRSWLDATIHFLIGGVYTTRRIDFYCKADATDS